MFTGFASENTPAIQVWDLFNTTTGTSRIALTDDCAPIQHFKTGGTQTALNLYLPSAPIEGKQLKIINANYSAAPQNINIYSSDVSADGTKTPFIVIGAGQTLDLCYSKNSINTAANVGQFLTGWISLNQSHIGAYNYNSVVLGGNNNYTNNGRCAVLGGQSNIASGQSSAVVGGSTNTANNTNAVTLGGSNLTASGSLSAVLAGADNLANADSSVVIGGRNGTTRSIEGNTIAPASASPISAVAGYAQSGLLILARQTTDATATVLASNASAAGTTNQVILPNNSAYYFRGECIAGKTAAGDTKGWYIEGVIKRGANAAATSIVGTATVTSLYADAGAATWAVTATANVTNGGLAITVTGQAATTIRWVCQIRTTEMTY